MNGKIKFRVALIIMLVVLATGCVKEVSPSPSRNRDDDRVDDVNDDFDFFADYDYQVGWCKHMLFFGGL